MADLSIGDILAVQALITNPLDWNHFYEKISVIKEGDRTNFTIVTDEGDRLIGIGNVELVEKWSNQGKYGFKIKVRINKQKSMTDRRHVRIESFQKGALKAEREVYPSIT
ncbi:MAG TPA: hypothetical protein VFD60_11810 [Nitrososphaeraceae archaeon]|nr:hypothetical protein [Nitrososphaeraceae archaeon]